MLKVAAPWMWNGTYRVRRTVHNTMSVFYITTVHSYSDAVRGFVYEPSAGFRCKVVSSRKELGIEGGCKEVDAHLRDMGYYLL